MKLLFTIVLMFVICKSDAQLDKKTWLLGGAGTIEKQKSYPNTLPKNLNIYASVNAGYFAFDKLGTGLRMSYNFWRSESAGLTKYHISKQFGIGPFLRYYFLKSTERLNLLADLNYQASFGTTNLGSINETHTFQNIISAKAGAVYFFNSAIALELLGEYVTIFEDRSEGRMDFLRLLIGFQIHLTKN